jgi:hypothetical protein
MFLFPVSADGIGVRMGIAALSRLRGLVVLKRRLDRIGVSAGL